MNVLTQDPLLSPALLLDNPALGTDRELSFGVPSLSTSGGADSIASQYPASSEAATLQNLMNVTNPMQSPMSMMFGPLGSILQYLTSMLSHLTGGSGTNQPAQNERYFSNASGGSNGDPHLSFNGSTWDNMSSQPDLINSDSIWGGYRVSTQTTAPNARGVTYNQSATVHTNFGETAVSLDNAGNATITQNGNTFPIQTGTTVDLGNGETVTRNTDGSLAITQVNGQGGSITTTMRDNGQGVDVNNTANNVDLGGTLVNDAPERPKYTRYAT